MNRLEYLDAVATYAHAGQVDKSGDLDLAINVLVLQGMASVRYARNSGVFVGSGPEAEQLAERAESLARVVARLRALRKEVNA